MDDVTVIGYGRIAKVLEKFSITRKWKFLKHRITKENAKDLSGNIVNLVCKRSHIGSPEESLQSNADVVHWLTDNPKITKCFHVSTADLYQDTWSLYALTKGWGDAAAESDDRFLIVRCPTLVSIHHGIIRTFAEKLYRAEPIVMQDMMIEMAPVSDIAIMATNWFFRKGHWDPLKVVGLGNVKNRIKVSSVLWIAMQTMDLKYKSLDCVDYGIVEEVPESVEQYKQATEVCLDCMFKNLKRELETNG